MASRFWIKGKEGKIQWLIMKSIIFTGNMKNGMKINDWVNLQDNFVNLHEECNKDQRLG